MNRHRFFICCAILLNIATFSYSVVVRVHDFSGYPGEIHFTKITIDDIGGLVSLAGIIALDIELTYDPNLLLVKNTSKGNVVPPEWVLIANTQSPGKIMIQMMSGLKDGEFVEINRIGEIVKISFQIANNAKTGQTSLLKLSKVYVNENAEIVTKIDGICNILGEQQNVIFKLILQPGWNLISLPIDIENPNLDTFLSKISGKYESIWSWEKENEWRKNIYNAPSWLNDLKVIQPGKGYWIKMLGQATIDISGKELNEHNIQLYKGWNLVGFNSLTQMTVDKALSSITGYYSSIWGYDPFISDWKKLIVGAPNQVNNLSALRPGEGYWIEARNDIVWKMKEGVAPSPVQFEYNHNRVHDLPIVPCLIYGEVNTAEFESVKLEDKVYVELKHDGYSLMKYRIRMKDNSYYSLCCEKSIFGKLLDINLLLNGKLIFSDKILCGHSGDIIRFDIKKLFLPKRNILYQNYPNPFNPETWIPYTVEKGSEVQIVIYDVNYRVIRNLDLGYKYPGSYITKDKSAYWDGKNDEGEPVASGLYFCNIKIGSFSATIKMSLLR